MSDPLDWTVVITDIQPIATEYLTELQSTLEEYGYEVSDIGERDEQGGIVWDITVETQTDTILVSFELVDSLEFEGEKLGYNVSVDAVSEDGQILVDHTPKNYTSDVWTNDRTELVERAKNIPLLNPRNL